jgi:hypothetical protein
MAVWRGFDFLTFLLRAAPQSRETLLWHEALYIWTNDDT